MADKKPCRTYVREDLEEIAKRTKVYVPDEKTIANTLIVKIDKSLYDYVLEQPDGVEKYISKLIREDMKKNK